jgi:hypothetical protein
LKLRVLQIIKAERVSTLTWLGMSYAQLSRGEKALLSGVFQAGHNLSVVKSWAGNRAVSSFARLETNRT